MPETSECYPNRTGKATDGHRLGSRLVESDVQRRAYPPLCVELVLKDRTRYYLHSVVAFEDETRTLCARIWDLRAFHPDEIDELRQKLNQIRTRSDLAPAEAVHPKLDWANLHLHYDDIAYCVEWHDRIWPDNEGSKTGHGNIKND